MVDKHEYDSLPFSTAGIARVPGGATLRTRRERRPGLAPGEAQQEAGTCTGRGPIRAARNSIGRTEECTVGLSECCAEQQSASAGGVARGSRPIPPQLWGGSAGAGKLPASVFT